MVKAAAVFSSNMVLQRNKNVKIWGEADESGIVTAEAAGVSARGQVIDGKWELTLPPMQAADNIELVLSFNGSEFARFTNVCIGEVWLCGGQSNMELELQNAAGGKDELAVLTPDMPIRFYYTNKVGSLEEALEAEKHAGWGTCDPEGSKAWSAVGYFFAKKLSKELGVTVGLIGCNWGGTSATNWIDMKSIENIAEFSPYLEEYKRETEGVSVEEQKKRYEEYKVKADEWNRGAQVHWDAGEQISWEELEKELGKNPWPGPRNDLNPFSPAKMYEFMLMRVCPYTLAGFLYYQGESDDHQPRSYYTLFTLLIRLWRERWGDDSLPFVFVQLPAFKYPDDPDYKHWCLIREAQMRAFETVKNTGIAVVLDCGELGNIHPLDKKTVGERLCLQAEKLVYGMDTDAFGPLYKSYTVDGCKLTVRLCYAKGMTAGDGGLTSFELAGEDKKYYPAEAEISGESIILTSKDVKAPVYARYAWGNFPEFSVFGANGIPLAPFRTSMYDE